MSKRTPFRWSRADGFVARFILVMAIGVTLFTTVFALVWITPLLPADGSVPANTITVPSPDGAPESAPPAVPAGPEYGIESEQGMVITFHDPTTVQRLLLVLPGLLAQAAALLVMVNLLRIVRSLDLGDPFVPANALRLRVIALTVLAGTLLVPAAEKVGEGLLRGQALGVDGFEISYVLIGEGGISFTMVFVSLLLLGLAEVFRRGTRMRDDVRGLV
ncbi:DUF2975 domain-containing protein [Nocardiopsis changdeensis]|uniref:DUF2975 domain-containing protein n=1 Tax=Nocardiopsis changdeensis TaxID=2831969 RepID=A0ABX8BRW6_9ACTN|nr:MULTISPECIES: DUF2975 domain-containing protein [Nocardiopsis]QUX24445.1 DUF2975 domain-containing protein [Nocardiopsis changdeensis]QYX34836.1 DUF2975 domain-containing protein [Nocardiopsis sp. MT53]